MDSAWNNRSVVKEFKKILKDEYNIDGKFHDCGDHYSFWRLRGLKNDLKKVLDDYWDGADIEDEIIKLLD